MSGFDYWIIDVNWINWRAYFKCRDFYLVRLPLTPCLLDHLVVGCKIQTSDFNNFIGLYDFLHDQGVKTIHAFTYLFCYQKNIPIDFLRRWKANKEIIKNPFRFPFRLEAPSAFILVMCLFGLVFCLLGFHRKSPRSINGCGLTFNFMHYSGICDDFGNDSVLEWNGYLTKN